jgi:CxxC-x17-CxxC domain-containing protein
MAFNDRNNFRGNNFGAPREMHKTTCSDCKAETEVPFKPDPYPNYSHKIHKLSDKP